MSTRPVPTKDSEPKAAPIDMKFEIVVIPVSEVFHSEVVFAGAVDAYSVGRVRVGVPDREHRDHRSFASFQDPDGNGCLYDELTTRLPGRIDSAATTFASVNDLASAMRGASVAHGKHEERTGGQRDENWPDWYAAYMVAEQSGATLP